MAQRFGNVTLGEINEMLISFIGKDMYLAFRGKVKDEAYDKNLRRLFKEDDKVDLSALSLYDEKSISKFVFEKILPDLQEEYYLSDELCNFMKDFVIRLYNRFTQHKLPILDYCSNFDFFRIQDYLEQAKQKYNSAFSIIQEKYKSLTEFCRLFPNEDTIKNNIKSMKRCQVGDNPTWSIMTQILNQEKEDHRTTSLLIDAFVMANIYASMHDKVLSRGIINPQYNETKLIYEGIRYFFVDYAYKKYEKRGDEIMKLIELSTPASEFYCNWFRGYHCVAKGELDDAKEYYKMAFAARRFAGCRFETFIKQAFALSCYLDFDADKVCDSADDNSKSKSPLSRDAKEYWNYGYTVGVFDRKAEETHLITYYRVAHILTYFGTELFPENSEFYKKLLNEWQMLHMFMLKTNENELNDEYENLSKLTEKKINTRMRLFGSHPTKNPPLTLALFYIDGCYSYGYADLAGKFMELIKGWLKNYENLKFDLCSDKGSTIACDAIQQYKNLKLRKLDLDLTEFKQIVMKIIEKSDSNSIMKNSLQKKRNAFQEAIESCDMDIVKAVIEKLNDIEYLRISPDEDSPVYYAISRYVCLYRYINDKTFKIQDGNINYKNLDVPGLTKEDKIQYIKAIESNPKLAEEIYKSIMQQSYGVQELWDSELVDIQNICLYLIEQTKDQDGYCKKTKDGNFVTSLLFAAESDNVGICRDLIKHNADPNRNYPDTFLQRCIYWESWDVLAMYLEKFPEKAKVGINDLNNIFRMPLMRAFLLKIEKTSKESYKCSTYINHIVKLFKNCGASYNL